MPTVYSPPVSTYVALATTTLGASASSVTFSSIPATYRDLVVVCNLFYSYGLDTYAIYQLNTDTTAANYKGVFIDTYNGTANSGSTNANLVEYHKTVSSSTPVQTIMQIMDYSATDKHTTTLIRFGVADGMTGAYATRWDNTAAVNEVKLVAPVADFLTGSTFSLYGIEA